MSQWQTLRRTNRLLHTQHHTTHNTQHKTPSPWSPKLPASSGSNFTGECNRRTSRNQSRSLQHGDVTFINKTNCSVILFTIILQAVAWRARRQKVSFICYYSCFFCATASEQHTLNLSYPAIFYLPIHHK
jgi:hypothetical protein